MKQILACAFLALATGANAAPNPTIISQEDRYLSPEDSFYSVPVEVVTCAVVMVTMNERVDAIEYAKWATKKYQTSIDQMVMFRETGLENFEAFVSVLTRGEASFIVDSAGNFDLTSLVEISQECKRMKNEG